MKQGELDLTAPTAPIAQAAPTAPIATKCKCGKDVPDACGYICICGRVFVNGSQAGWSYGDSDAFWEEQTQEAAR